MLQEQAALTVVAVTMGHPRGLKYFQAVPQNRLELHPGVMKRIEEQAR
jgi:hypothetical protein